MNRFFIQVFRGGEWRNVTTIPFEEGNNRLDADQKYLRQFGLNAKSCTAGALWKHLLANSSDQLSPSAQGPLRTILEQGPLSRRIIRALDGDVIGRLTAVYRRLCDCLAEGRLFE